LRSKASEDAQFITIHDTLTSNVLVTYALEKCNTFRHTAKLSAPGDREKRQSSLVERVRELEDSNHLTPIAVLS